jgi:hypothetical protein
MVAAGNRTDYCKTSKIITDGVKQQKAVPRVLIAMIDDSGKESTMVFHSCGEQSLSTVNQMLT